MGLNPTSHPLLSRVDEFPSQQGQMVELGGSGYHQAVLAVATPSELPIQIWPLPKFSSVVAILLKQDAHMAIDVFCPSRSGTWASTLFRLSLLNNCFSSVRILYHNITTITVTGTWTHSPITLHVNIDNSSAIMVKDMNPIICCSLLSKV
jgi:hypothetical protein